MPDFKIAYAPGDGIGPEVVGQARRVLDAVGKRYGHTFGGVDVEIGAASIKRCGVELTDQALQACKGADSVLLGACGVEAGAAVNGRQPERAVLDLRREMGLWSNLRPVRVSPHLADATPLKASVVRDVDMLVVRELTGGIYFSLPKERRRVNGEWEALDTLRYSETEVRRVVRRAFELAGERRRKVASVDKSNVLESSRFWREIAISVAAEHPEVQFESILVDAFAIRLLLNPRAYDVVVTENMFGDILTDEAGALLGSLGMGPSGSLGDGAAGLYEPIHGAAPDIAGKGLANPIGTVLSAAMMLEMSFGLQDEARAVEEAVERALAAGYRTADIKEDGSLHVGTAGMGDAIIAGLTA